MIPFLLQQDIQFFARPDPNANRTTLIILGILIALSAIAGFISSRRRKSGKRGGFSVRREAKKIGLSREQTRSVKELAHSLSLQNPSRLLTDPGYLSHALRRRFKEIDAEEPSPAIRERQKSMLFSVRRLVAMAASRTRVIQSTRTVKPGQLVTIRTADGDVYESMVTSNVHNGLGVELPYDRRGGAVAWSKSTPLEISFVVDPDRLFRFRTKVIGYNNLRGASAAFVEHATNVRQTQKRRSPRRDFDRPCYFYSVTVVNVGKGRKARRQAYVDKNRRVYGKFEDLSSGGCAIRTQTPFTAGSIIKVDFQTSDGEKIAVFGKVRSVDRSRRRAGVMHIMFTRVSRKHLNQIQSYVYGVAEE